MFEAWIQALSSFASPVLLGTMFIATIVGLVIGVTPGIGGLLGVALLLPLVYKLDATIAIGFLVALHAVTVTGGSVTAILLNIPGTGTNAATLIDGFPMTQRGEGGRALGAAITSSMFGGLLPPLLAIGMIPLVSPIVMSFRRAEMALLIMLGLACMSALVGRSVIKGLISSFLGVLFSMVGFHGLTGIPRFTFGSVFLFDGFGIVVITLGLFGLAEMIDIAMKKQTQISVQSVKPSMRDVLKGARDVFVHRWLWFRCTLIGYIIGIIPGIGGEAAIFVSYAHAKQTSKYPEKFGTGVVEGVIAPESANNAKDAGALLTTMAFGIPGSVVMAIFIGAFLAVGVIPGPTMLREHLPLAFTLLIGIALANVIGGIVSMAAAPYLARIATLHMDYVFPLTVSLIISGAYVMRRSMLNVIIVFLFGVLGLIMKRLDYSRPAFLLGFVLGGLFELYLFHSLKFYGPFFFIESTTCIILIALIIVMIFYPYWQKIAGILRR